MNRNRSVGADRSAIEIGPTTVKKGTFLVESGGEILRVALSGQGRKS